MHARGRRISRIMIVALVMALLVVASVVMAQQSRQDQQRQDQQRQDQQRQDQQRMTSRQNQATTYFKANDLTGMPVYSQDGEEIGNFENIVFDRNRQRVLYAVVAEGGFLGIGENLHAVPWDWVTQSRRADRVILPINEGVLEDAPGFDQYPTQGVDREVERWADNPPSPQQWRQVRFQTDRSRFDSDDPNIKMRKATDLIGLEVEASGTMYGADDGGYHDGGMYDDYGYDDDYGYENGYGTGFGDAAGEISDLLISENGTLDFAIIEGGEDFFGTGDEEYIAVPWARVTVHPEEEVAVAGFTQQEARSLVISENEIDRLGDPNFRDQFFGAVGVDYYTWVDAVERGERFNGTDQRRQSTQQDRRSEQRTQAQQQEIRQWSNFTQRCLGRNLRGNETMRGSVQSVGMMRPGRTAEAPAGRSFTLSPRNRQPAMTVYLGPEGMIPQNLSLNRGDRVTVRGSECRIGNRNVFVATEIQTDYQTFNLTQRNGTPHWEARGGQYGQQSQRGRQQFGQQQRRQQDPMQKWSNFTDQCLGRNLQGDQQIRGEVRGVGTLYTPDNAPAPDGRRFTVMTRNNERVTVFAGPNEVAAPLSLSRGNQVTVHGSECQVNGRDVFVATRIESDGQVFMLEDRDGTPQWRSQDQGRQQQGQNERRR